MKEVKNILPVIEKRFPMAIILNIETATTVCSVSLGKDGELLALKEINGDYSHAENLTLFIEDVCKQANMKLSQIDAIAVSKGPGSYTGLRIGVSTAKGSRLGRPRLTRCCSTMDD